MPSWYAFAGLGQSAVVSKLKMSRPIRFRQWHFAGRWAGGDGCAIRRRQDPAPLTTPSHDHRGIGSPSGTSSADRWYRDIVVVVAHAK